MTYDHIETKRVMKVALSNCLEFIVSLKGAFPLPMKDYTDVKVEYNKKEWSTYAVEVVDINTWSKKDEMLRIPAVRRALGYLSEVEKDLITEINDRTRTPSPSTQDERFEDIQKYQIISFISTYINKFGLTFDATNFEYTFSALFDHFPLNGRKRRIFILRNFFLEGLESAKLLGHTIRPIKSFEIRLLIGMGSYNKIIPHYPLWDLPKGLIETLNPMYCIEFPPLKFPESREELFSEFLTKRVLGLLLTFKEGVVSMETELNYDPMEEFRIPSGSSGSWSWSELHRYFHLPYVLSIDEYKRFQEYNEQYGSINFYDDREVDLAIRRFLAAKWRSEEEDAIIDYMIALEALLSNSGQEIQYRISLGIAHLLDEDPEEMRKTFEIMQRLYNLRNKVVHGNVEGIKKEMEKVNNLKGSFPEGTASPEDVLRYYTRAIIKMYVQYSSSSKERNHKKNF